MRSFVKYLVLGGLIASAGLFPALAIEGNLIKRAPLCLLREKVCTAQFYLNPKDDIEILHSSLDQKWFKVRYLGNGKEGWIQSEYLKLIFPEGIELNEQWPIKGKGPFQLIFSKNEVQMLQGHTVFSLPSKKEGVLKSVLANETLQSVKKEEGQYTLYTQQALDKERFLLRWQETLGTSPYVKTLLRLDPLWKAPPQVAETPDYTLILAQGNGEWGDSLLVGLNKKELPVILLKTHEDIFPLMDFDIRSKIVPNSVFLSGLSPDGTLFVTVQFRFNLKFGLLMIKPQTSVPWKASGFINWPSGYAPHSAKKKSHLPLELYHRNNTTYLIFPQTQTLFYYSIKPESLFSQKLKDVKSTLIGPKGSLWTLDEKTMKKWTIKKGAN